jgi:hypothetical protein
VTPVLPLAEFRPVPPHWQTALRQLSPRLAVRWAPARKEWQVLIYKPFTPRRADGRKRRARNRGMAIVGRTRAEQALLMSEGWALLWRTSDRHLTMAALAHVHRAWHATRAAVHAVRAAQEAHTDTLHEGRKAARRAYLQAEGKDIYRRTFGARVMGRPIRSAS